MMYVVFVPKEAVSYLETPLSTLAPRSPGTPEGVCETFIARCRALTLFFLSVISTLLKHHFHETSLDPLT